MIDLATHLILVLGGGAGAYFFASLGIYSGSNGHYWSSTLMYVLATACFFSFIAGVGLKL